MYQPLLRFGDETPSAPADPEGVVYTKPWAVDLVLDLAGYGGDENLVDAVAVEPAAGEGAFLIPMATRLISSCLRQGRPFSDCEASIIAYELDGESARTARVSLMNALGELGVPGPSAGRLADGWIRVGDYLLEASSLPPAEFVIGNPPYIRLESIPEAMAGYYRDAYPSMRGRADIYVAFFEAALRQLRRGGACAFVCADRWMLNQYGAELRGIVTSGFGVEFVVEMHDADAFVNDVSAYPAITVIRRGPQGRAVVASVGATAGSATSGLLAAALRSSAAGRAESPPSGLAAASLDRWFKGSEPWPCGSPARLELLRKLEERFEPLESGSTGNRIGIGVATGLDEIFITKDPGLVEPSRLLPLAMARDTADGHFRWSGHQLVNPWDANGLVDLGDFPRLRAYFEEHEARIRGRNTARRNPDGWFRTIDRVNVGLTTTPKLYIHDIKDVFNPVFDPGTSYPHHNLYYVVSESWDLELLGGLLMSSIGQLFIEAYGVRMRGGYLRFQAQYLRRVRVPEIAAISAGQAEQLIGAFRRRDRERASELALEIYGVDGAEIERANRR